MAQQRSDGLTPAFLASALLHGAVALAALFAWEREPKEIKPGKTVPITIVTNAPTTNLRPAVEADVDAPAQTPEPTPDASPNLIAPPTAPEPSPPAPTPPKPTPTPPKPAPPPPSPPTPAPPKPTPLKPAPPQPKPAPKPEPAKPTPPKPVPKPTPTPAKPQPAPAKPAPAPAPAKPQPSPAKPAPSAAPAAPAKPAPPSKAQAPSQGLDLDALAASLAKSAKPSGKPRSSAAQGAAKPPTAAQAQPDAGTADQIAAVGDMKQEIQRLWNPNCDVEGGDKATVTVYFTLNRSGAIVGAVTAGGQEDSDDAIAKAAADRAIRAVYRAAPYPDLPPSYYNARLKLNFKASEACRG